MARELSDGEQVALGHLLWVWRQYGDFRHDCMTAGEEAAAYLSSLGLGEISGTQFVPSESGRRLMESVTWRDS